MIITKQKCDSLGFRLVFGTIKTFLFFFLYSSFISLLQKVFLFFLDLILPKAWSENGNKSCKNLQFLLQSQFVLIHDFVVSLGQILQHPVERVSEILTRKMVWINLLPTLWLTDVYLEHECLFSVWSLVSLIKSLDLDLSGNLVF